MNKIRQVDLKVCNREQLIAYEFCFRFRDVLFVQNNNRLEVTKKLLLPLKYYTNVDYDAVNGYILRNIERYIERGKLFFENYEEIGTFFK